MAHATTSLTFLMECRDKNIIPNGLRIKDPCNIGRSQILIQRIERALLRNLINSTKYRKYQTRMEISNIVTNLRNTMNLDHWNQFDRSVDVRYNQLWRQLRNIHRSKLNRLMVRHHNPIRQSSIDTNKVVVNKSHRELSKTETEVLSKGLNYAIAPKKQPSADIITGLECAAHFLPQDKKEEFRFEIRQALDKPSRPTQNLTRDQLKALKDLKKDDTIVILPADKGKAVVLLDSLEYHNKINELVSDNSKFQKIKSKNPITKIEKELKQMIKKVGLEKEVMIKEHCKPPHIYGLPKVHKEGVPLRPVVSCIGSSVHPLAKYLAKILNPLQNRIPSNIKNSMDFITKIKDLDIADNTRLVSLDVVSLFTSVPVQPALEVLREALTNDNTLQERTKLTVDQILELTSLCVNNTVFTYKDTFYKQTEGMAMGSPLSPIICNVYMDRLEKDAIESSPKKPTLWLRYVDDTFLLWDHSSQELGMFLEHMNIQKQQIKFTMEIEVEGRLPFLDVLVTRSGSSLVTAVYRKPTHTDQYLHFKSNHPRSTKLGILKSMFLRADRICSNENIRGNEKEHIKKAFEKNGYPRSCFNTTLRKPRGQMVSTSTAIVPYSGALTDKLRRICGKYSIKLVAHSKDTIRTRLSNVAPIRNKDLKQDVVYNIPLSCQKVYIGETGRCLKTRMAEHRNALRNASFGRSGVADHCVQCGCIPNFEETKIVATVNNTYKRRIRESIEMTLLGPINVGEKSIEISRIWNKAYLERIMS